MLSSSQATSTRVACLRISHAPTCYRLCIHIKQTSPMASAFTTVLTVTSILTGFASAGCWFRSSIVKVTRDEEVARRHKEAAKTGQTPNLAGVTLDGWDMSATFTAQSRWNAWG